MSNYLYIKDWAEWQTYRKDRATPPWIKVHRKLLSNPKWAMLSDAEKGQLISIWMVAADNDGKVPSNAKVLRKICQLDDDPSVERLQELGFLVTSESQGDSGLQPSDNHMTTTCQPSDAAEGETEAEGETDIISSNEDMSAAKQTDVTPHKKIVEIWNEVCGGAGLAKVETLNSSRRAAIKARWNDSLGKSLDRWRAYCELVTQDDWWMGRVEGSQWKGNFDSAMTPTKITKMFEKQTEADSEARGWWEKKGAQHAIN